jgi:hypothetical protein
LSIVLEEGVDEDNTGKEGKLSPVMNHYSPTTKEESKAEKSSSSSGD